MNNKGTIYIVRLKGFESSRVSNEMFHRLFRMETGKTINYDGLDRGPHGKPEPIDGVFFNISHSRNYYAVAFCGVECGIDIEEPREISEGLKKRILRHGERILKGDVLNNWVLKEAYSKYLGLGLNMDFREVSVDGIFDSETVLDLSRERYVCFVVSGEKVDFNVVEMTTPNTRLRSRQHLCKSPH